MTFTLRDSTTDTEVDVLTDDEWEAARLAQLEADRTGNEQHLFEPGIHGNYITSFSPSVKPSHTGPIHLMTERAHVMPKV
jgi:hypothetical protein